MDKFAKTRVEKKTKSSAISLFIPFYERKLLNYCYYHLWLSSRYRTRTVKWLKFFIMPLFIAVGKVSWYGNAKKCLDLYPSCRDLTPDPDIQSNLHLPCLQYYWHVFVHIAVRFVSFDVNCELWPSAYFFTGISHLNKSLTKWGLAVGLSGFVLVEL